MPFHISPAKTENKQQKDKNFIPVARIDQRHWEAICLQGTAVTLTLYVSSKGRHFLSFVSLHACINQSSWLFFKFEVGNIIE